MTFRKIPLGLPERLEKAKTQIAVFEKREAEIAALLDESLLFGDEELLRQYLRDIIGHSDG